MEKIARDLWRVSILLVVSGVALFWMDAANVVIYQAALIALFQVGCTHLTRRILFPAIDLQLIAKKAIVENNVPAALIFASIIAFLISVMFLSTQVLK